MIGTFAKVVVGAILPRRWTCRLLFEQELSKRGADPHAIPIGARQALVEEAFGLARALGRPGDAVITVVIEILEHWAKRLIYIVDGGQPDASDERWLAVLGRHGMRLRPKDTYFVLTDDTNNV